MKLCCDAQVASPPLSNLIEERLFTRGIPCACMCAFEGLRGPVTDTNEMRREDGDSGGFRFSDAGRNEIELVETTEVPVAHRVARVVEEVRVSKTLVERTADVHATVRHTEIDVVPFATEDGWTVA